MMNNSIFNVTDSSYVATETNSHGVCKLVHENLHNYTVSMTNFYLVRHQLVATGNFAVSLQLLASYSNILNISLYNYFILSLVTLWQLYIKTIID